MKLIYAFALLLLVSCSVYNDYSYYSSNVPSKQETKSLISNFHLSKKYEDGLPFGILGAYDKKPDGSSNFYVLFSIYKYSDAYGSSVESYLHNLNVALLPKQARELLTNLEVVSNKTFETKNRKEARNFEFVVNPTNKAPIIDTVSYWDPQFGLYVKQLEDEQNGLLFLGILKNKNFLYNYQFTLSKEQIVEIKSRLTEALLYLSDNGYKEN